eukprot:CAMPEP_0197483216 /NCGR_PEP_ID=MMETSP1309-20131121/56771_1 /TAXON_ID=464262 /ORGANISM="Genus nov. species nov., Strain RCC998" /LENGTH=340 /DNA_ID=CAMNT_0043025809 /DNA_START=296 /DNA_END=1319 /DNA_ORIENTATION=-
MKSLRVNNALDLRIKPKAAAPKKAANNPLKLSVKPKTAAPKKAAKKNAFSFGSKKAAPAKPASKPLFNFLEKKSDKSVSSKKSNKSVSSKKSNKSVPAKPASKPLFNFLEKKSNKSVSSKKSNKSVGSKIQSSGGVAAQSFEIRIPGQFFQAKNDIVWPISLGFTKSNELFVGRMAMLGFAASLLGELLTGKGALAQFDLETGLPLFDTEPLVLALIAFNVFAAFAPGKGKFVEDVEEKQVRPAGSLQDPSISLLTPGKFLGISRVGFTKDNELFVGRMAQLGFAASLIGEVITGKGALAQFNCETGIPLADAEPLLLFSIVLLGLTAVNEGTGKFVDEK